MNLYMNLCVFYTVHFSSTRFKKFVIFFFFKVSWLDTANNIINKEKYLHFLFYTPPFHTIYYKFVKFNFFLKQNSVRFNVLAQISSRADSWRLQIEILTRTSKINSIQLDRSINEQITSQDSAHCHPYIIFLMVNLSLIKKNDLIRWDRYSCAINCSYHTKNIILWLCINDEGEPLILFNVAKNLIRQ